MYTDEAGWRALWEALAVEAPGPAVYAELCQRYGEPTRAYHTLTHIAECLAHFAQHAVLAIDPAAVTAALWFHDVIYDPHCGDNEAASAAWAGELLTGAGVAAAQVAVIEQLILDTQHTSAPSTADGALVVDLDLAILGAAPARFAEYEAQIRHEYQWVPWPTYCARRVAVLQHFLARPTIYQTAPLCEQFEAAARRNLASSIAQLTAASLIDNP